MQFLYSIIILASLLLQISSTQALEIKKDVVNNRLINFETTAKYAYLLDYETGTPLFAKNALDMVTPSSMSKIMTVYIVFHQLKSGALKMQDEFAVSEKAWRMGGSRMFLDLNTKVTVQDLLKGIIVQSGNDACVVLAEGIAGSEEAFVHYMNEAAKELGLQHSHFANASGWPHPEHKMSAEDLAKLAAVIIREYPEYYQMFAETDFKYNKIHQPNRNVLIGTMGVDGLKTGHTDEAGYGIVISSVQNGKRLIAVVNGLSSMKERAVEAERLLRYGFNNFVTEKFFNAQDIIGQVPIQNGKDLNIPVVANQEVALMLPRSLVKSEIKTYIEYDDKLSAPILINQKVGVLLLKNNDNIIKAFPLHALQANEEASIFQKIWRKTKSLCGIQ